MVKMPTVGSVMTAFPYFVELDAHAATAKTMLAQYKVHHLPVREGDRVVGIVTESDLRQAQAFGWDISSASNVRVADVCNRETYVVAPEEPLDAVLVHMAQAPIDVVCVVRDGKLAGIFTFTDACRQFAQLLRAQAPR